MQFITDRPWIRASAALFGLAITIAACSSGGYGATSASASPAGGGKYGGASPDGYATPASGSPAASATAGGGEAYAIAVASGAVGSYLTGEDGRTLYTFKPDGANTSTCTDACATAWPPFTVSAADTLAGGAGVTGKLTTFARADGTMQVAHDGVPLYYFASDTKAGDTNGQGIGGKWFVAAP